MTEIRVYGIRGKKKQRRGTQEREREEKKAKERKGKWLRHLFLS